MVPERTFQRWFSNNVDFLNELINFSSLKLDPNKLLNKKLISLNH